MEIKDKELLW